MEIFGSADVIIGNNAVICAGSIVSSDILFGVLAYGVPCKVIRTINKVECEYKS